MGSKLIGLVMASMDSETTLELYNGISKRAAEYGYSTQGFVIYPSQDSTEEYNRNEFFILETIDYSLYDAVIVALDTIAFEGTRNVIREQLSELSIPIIAIDCDLPNSYKINTANYEAVKGLVYHLNKVHGRTRINYVSGPSTNAESNLRETAYQHAMRELGLSTEGRVFEGKFFVNDGFEALDHFTKDEKVKDFDAIICGNDMSAISMICELQKWSFKVPEDVAVAGFDDISECTQVVPNLTTITKDNYEVGRTAINLLNKLWNGESISKTTYVQSRAIHRASCGCVNEQSRPDELHENYKLINSFTFTKLFREYSRTFMIDGSNCANFEEYLKVIEHFAERVNPGLFSVHIHERFCRLFGMTDYPKIRVLNKDGSYSTMINVVFYTHGAFLPLKADDMVPALDFSVEKMKNAFPNMEAMQFLNSPLHFQGEKIGFVIFGNSDFPTLPDLYFEWLNTVNVTLNNIYNRMLLTELYRNDSLTGLYNRFGMKYFWEEIQNTMQERKTISIVFADLNGLKQINDNYGHEEGDFAISFVANELKTEENERLKAIRFGGDEFILLGMNYTKDEMDIVMQRVQVKIANDQKNLGKPYVISASFGSFVRNFDDSTSLDDCIKAADEIMYEKKKKRYQK